MIESRLLRRLSQAVVAAVSLHGFCWAGDTLPVPGSAPSYSSSHYPTPGDSGFLNHDSDFLFSASKLAGPGGQQIGIQSFAIDERFGNLYTLQLSGKRSGNQSTINRFSFKDRSKLRTEGYSNPPSAEVGHQGLGIEYLPGRDFRLWSTANIDSRQVTRYRYADGRSLDQVQLFRLFGDDFRNHTSATPTISYDQKYLVAYGMRRRTSTIVVRAWRLADLVKAGPGDYSKSFTYEWETKKFSGPPVPIQGIASDGVRVWILAGNNSIDSPKRLQSYSIEGELQSSNEHVWIGRDQARNDGSGMIYEPEGLALLRAGNGLILCAGIISGDLGRRQARIYQIERL